MRSNKEKTTNIGFRAYRLFIMKNKWLCYEFTIGVQEG